MKHVLLTLSATALLSASAAAVVVWRGWYDVSASSGHTTAVNRLLTLGMEWSVRRRAASIQTPPLDDAALVVRGAACYRDHCEQCHGGPGVPPGTAAMGMQPLPGPLLDATRRFSPAEVYWITRHGIKMTGMPAWELRLPDHDLWAVAAFVRRLPQLMPATYGETMAAHPGRCLSHNEACIAGSCMDTPPAPGISSSIEPRPPGDAARLAFRQYACVGCHQIPGIVGADALVGPSLEGWARRKLIAGRRPNTVDELTRFIRHPRSVRPDTPMPELGVTEAHARLMADYLLAAH